MIVVLTRAELMVLLMGSAVVGLVVGVVLTTLLG